MILQNNKELLPIIQELGCYYMSLMRIVELETGHDFIPTEINAVWTGAKQRKYISAKDDIINPDAILKMFTYYTKRPHLTVAQVGEEKNNKTVFWRWAEKIYNKPNYLVEMVLTDGRYGTHFRLCDINKQVIYDSYSYREYNSRQSGRYLLYMKLN